MNKKIRIKDIATMAGVSEGTVDRVLHHRGEVSEKSRAAVQKILDELNYKPNIHARSLALKKQYTFAVCLPAYQEGDYWEAVDKGISLAESEFSNFHIQTKRYFYNQFEPESFKEQTEKINEDTPDAVIMAPIFSDEAKKWIETLQAGQIPYGFVDSMVDTDDFLCYYGQHSFQSGWIAAKLLLEHLPEKSKVLLVRMYRAKSAINNQTKNRYKGFMAYVHAHGLDTRYKYTTMLLQENNPVGNHDMLERVFKENPNTKAAIIFNSRAYKLAQLFEATNRTDIRLIGYDLLEKNVAYLKNGLIDCLIAQRPEQQAYLLIRDFCRKLVFGQEITQINYIPIDILISENVDYYLNFNEFSIIRQNLH